MNIILRVYKFLHLPKLIRPRCTVGNVSSNRCEFDCRSRVASSIPAQPHTFMEIDYEINFTVILLSSAESFKNHSRRIVVRYKQKYVHEVLVNCLFKLAQLKNVGR